MTGIYSNKVLLDKQYKNSKNLQARIAFHENYSTNKINWFNWIFNNMDLAGGEKVLEVGCGNGLFWKKNINEIPNGSEITLSDFSSGMLEDARNNLCKTDFSFKYENIDVQSIPYEDNTFDIVLANGMLYHVPDIHKALCEIRRILKPGGKLFATTAGKSHMKEIRDLVEEFDSTINFPTDNTIYKFGLENGKDIISKSFSNIDLLLYKDSIFLTEAKPLVEYVISCNGLGNLETKIIDSKIEEFGQFLNNKIKTYDEIHITKEPCMFVAR